MKSLFVLTLIALVGVFVAAEAFAAQDREQASSTRPSRSTRYSRRSASRRRRDPNSVRQGLPFLADTNAVRTSLKEFKGLGKEVGDLSKSGERVTREWARGAVEDRMGLAESVHEQAVKELTLIRKLAMEEGALKTTAVIDNLLLARQERYGKTLDRMEAERDKMLRYERGTRRARRSRGMRGRGYERGQNMGAYREGSAYRDGGYDPYQQEERRGRRRSSRSRTREPNSNSAY
ncbi:MAG: hypothetical protein ACYS4W_07455 [Planctomycetota bacterium]